MPPDILNTLIARDHPAAQNGDTAAFGRLVSATQRMVASVALAVTRDVQSSGDNAQDTVLTAWPRLPQLGGPGGFLPWQRQVARNRAIAAELRLLLCAGLLALLPGCVESVDGEPVVGIPGESLPEAPAAEEVASLPGGQRGGGRPYEIVGSEVWDVPDPVSGRDYQVFVAVPPSYAENPGRRYPVLYVTDADYAFPVVRQIGRRLNGNGPKVDEFILVGLSYARGEDAMASRRRDYTPTPNGAADAPSGSIHGMGDAYRAYLRDQVLPFIAGRYRTDEGNRNFLGHSYGGLLGTQILFTEPGLFHGYILGSPSYWYDAHYMARMEADYAASSNDLPARVYLYVGQYEDMKPGDPRYATRHNMVTDARRMATSLRARNYPSLQLHLDVLPDEDHLTVAPGGFSRGLKHLLGTDRRRAPGIQ